MIYDRTLSQISILYMYSIEIYEFCQGIITDKVNIICGIIIKYYFLEALSNLSYDSYHLNLV